MKYTTYTTYFPLPYRTSCFLGLCRCKRKSNRCFFYPDPAYCTYCTAQAPGIPIGKVRIIKPYIGGGFGNKQDVLYEPLNAFLTMSVGGRPVRLEISREETISGTRTRHAIEGVCRGLVTKDGTVLARQLDAYANNLLMLPMLSICAKLRKCI